MTEQGFTYFCRVFGCQMNVADIDDLKARLCAHGGLQTDDAEVADLVLVNTCTVRQKAEDKARSFFGGLKRAKGVGGRPFIAALGCLIPGNREQFARAYPQIDLFIDYSDPDLAFCELARAFAPLSGAELLERYTPLADPRFCQMQFVTAIRGCDHGCSFCVVPLARGPQRDVPLARVVLEAQAHEAAGAPDIAVLGQNILAWGRCGSLDSQMPAGEPRFVELMQALLAQTSLPWITFLTSLPSDLTERICESVIGEPRITPLLHLPVQSGSDKVLGEMRRGHDTAHFKRMVAKARACRHDLFLTTDLLVGFPTETEADFDATLALIEEVGFDDAFMFAYSPRRGTHSAQNYPDRLTREQKIARLSTLIARQRAISAERNKRYIGQVLPVIIERGGEGGENAVARTAFNKPVRLAACRTPVGQYASVRITTCRVSSFSGEEV